MTPFVRLARPEADADCDAIGQLLHDFNVEFDAPTPPPASLAARLRTLMKTGETVVLLGHVTDTGPPIGLSVFRFRPDIWSEDDECYVAELYVVPDQRSRGLGRALMEETMAVARRRGANRIELGTEETDVQARKLYESLGFLNREGGPEGPLMYFYEREL
jgi:ribosomal protein S18 acetylase RimI-like enzyme